MTDQVISCREGGGDGRGPRAALVDHLALAPGATGEGAAEKTGLVDLELFGKSA